MRVYQITVRNKAAGLAIGATALVVGGALLALGLTLFAVLGAGAVVIRRLTGKRAARALDPALEIFSPASTDATREITSPD
jgi:hypothetical protein